MPKISVIIPIYNVEQYLPKCLDSVINQTYKDIEIICIDDCSPDNSIKIIEDYASKDQRIKIVDRKQNGGLSAARNSGLDVAMGEYIYFIDSDDWIDVNYLEKMAENIKSAQTDFVVNLNLVRADTNEALYMSSYLYKFQNNFFVSKTLADRGPWSACVSLYKRDFLNKFHLRFPEGYIHEDVYFHYMVYLRADKAYAFNGPAYYYRIQPNSIMRVQKDLDISELKTRLYLYENMDKYSLLDNRLKLFKVPHKIMDEVKLHIYQQSIFKMKSYLLKTLDLYDDIELFIMYLILYSNTYKEFFSLAHCSDFRIDFIKHKHKRDFYFTEVQNALENKYNV